MKILAQSCCLFVRHVETEELSLTFLTYQIKVLVSVFIEKHKQHFTDILLFMEATNEKINNCVILSQLFFAMVNSYLIVYCAITCYVTWS